MIEYLEKLVEERNWKAALDYAERLMQSTENPPDVLLRIHLATLLARHELSDFAGALASGRSALELARHLKAWDGYGEACVNLGSAYGRLGYHQHAVELFSGYLEKLPEYSNALQYEALAWFNLGKGKAALGDLESCSTCYVRAQSAATRLRNHLLAHTVRMALLEVYLQLGQFNHIPRLLAQSAHYIRNNAPALDKTTMNLFFLWMRCQYALRTGRLLRATLIGVRGLELSGSTPRHAASFHLVLSKINEAQDQLLVALGHANSARVWAAMSNRPDLEAEAAFAAERITQCLPPTSA